MRRVSVDCIYEGERALYIHPTNAWTAVPVNQCAVPRAIFYEDDLPSCSHLDDNAAFFTETLRGRDEALNSQEAQQSRSRGCGHAACRGLAQDG